MKSHLFRNFNHPTMTSLNHDIAREILSYLLKVPDHDFHSSLASGRHELPESTSQYLLVCKRWYEAGRPLFYRCITLLSLGQVDSFLRTIREDAHLTTYIRRVHYECPFDAATRELFESLPTDKDITFFFSDKFLQRKNYGLYLNILRSLQPKHVILQLTSQDNLTPKIISRVMVGTGENDQEKIWSSIVSGSGIILLFISPDYTDFV